jgi:hypothetical protein
MMPRTQTMAYRIHESRFDSRISSVRMRKENRMPR